MAQLKEVHAARPFALARDEGERIFFTNAAMTMKATADSTGGALCAIETVAPVGHAAPLHVHHDEHEAFYVLEGELEIACGGQRYGAPAGAFAFLPSGVAHTFRVVGTTPARMLTLAVPGGLEGFFRDVGRPAEHAGLPPAAPPDIDAMRRVAERHNVEIVGPPLAADKPVR
jgi:mannose-6-phosphate isomerase-like protein (cupin superfamily)